MRAALLALTLFAWPLAAQAGDAIEGLWKTAPQDDGAYGFVKIAPCGPAFCGVLTRGVNAAGEVATSGGNVGKRIVWDMVAQGDGLYDSGKIWSPDRDKTYAAKLQLSGNSLAVSGCVIGICRDGGTWVRQ